MINKLKKMVKNKSRVEGSICEAYLAQETVHFCSYYFEPDVQSRRTRVGRNEYLGDDEMIEQCGSIFNLSGRPSGACKRRYLNDDEYKAARLYVLLNCTEVEPYIE